MTRLHADPVEVQRHDTGLGPEPAQFLWRGRLYVVREVLAHWTEAGRWWEGGAVGALTAGDPAAAVPAGERSETCLETPLETQPIPSSPRWAQRAWGEPAPDVGASIGPAGIDDRERDWWRVEAGARRATGTPRFGQCGVYDLCFDWSRGSWSLARVLD